MGGVSAAAHTGCACMVVAIASGPGGVLLLMLLQQVYHRPGAVVVVMLVQLHGSHRGRLALPHRQHAKATALQCTKLKPDKGLNAVVVQQRLCFKGENRLLHAALK